MSSQGARAQAEDTETRRVFAVSQVRLGADGHIADVLWTEWNPKSNLAVGAEVRRSVAEVVDALHDGARVAAYFAHAAGALPQRPFVVLEHADGRETIALEGPPSAGREIGDIAKFGVAMPPASAPDSVPKSAHPSRHGAAPRMKPVFAVSRVRLDPDGRVTAVQWGRVDTRANAWATPESLAPVAEVVQAIQAGDPG